MARRHPSLIPLSRDHYDGLLLAHQLGEPHRSMMEGWPDHDKERGHFVAGFYRKHLAHHFLVEEQFLFPLIVQHVPEGKALVNELLEEHRRIEQMVNECDHADTASIPPLLKQFSGLLERHIRKEERKLFPLFEEHAPAEVLDTADRLIHQQYPEP